MRYRADHKEKTRELVLDEAAKAIRRDGPHRISLDLVMKRAGLTHGGFYGYFSSREALLTAAVGRMFDGVRARWARETADRTPAQGLTAYVRWYLSEEHRDSREAGCAMAALAADLPRLSPTCRRVYAEGVRKTIEEVASHLRTLGHPSANATATSAVAELVGAISLARAERDPRRSRALLAVSRKSVLQRLLPQ